MLFYLGTHCDSWLNWIEVPLFVSARRLRRRKALPVAHERWALDSGGFSELSMYGAWQTTPEQYAREVALWSGEIGRMDWAAVQDWMVEPIMLRKTGLSLPEHQRRTIVSYLRLRELAPALPWMPVVQGWGAGDYLRHVDQYASAGVDLAALPVVGVGSVCRRQATGELTEIVSALHRRGLRLHAFGIKLAGIAAVGGLLASADSLAWSYNARAEHSLPGCSHGRYGVGNCANCPTYALRWREKILAAAVRPRPEKIIDL